MNLFVKFSNLRSRLRALLWRDDRGEDDQNVATLLEDLRAFCRADASCVVVGKDGRIDTHATAVAEGRREVWLRIVARLNLTDDQLLLLVNRKENEHE